MKLALIGGGGVRAPEFVRGALAFAAHIDLQEVWLMDIDPARLSLIAPLCAEIVRRAGSPFRLFQTTVLDDALRDAAVVVTTMRVGGDDGRVFDERIALRHGVLGQETTGAGGFSMALRSIPALLNVMSRVEQLAPRAWTFNFTNPAGLVAQAVYAAGFRRTVGICDSANTAQHDIARYLGLPPDAVKTEVFGLNHLSWTRRALVGGRDVLPDLLRDEHFIQATRLRYFGAELVGRLGMYLNEYLFYYYLRDVALERIQSEERTRGEEILHLNRVLFEQLGGKDPTEALSIYDAYHQQRNATYMTYAEQDTAADNHPPAPTDIGGYAGVALKTAAALLKDRPLRIGLNVPNNGAIDDMRPDDVVEITCEVDGGGIHPLMIGSVPEASYLLMRTVKQYERLAVEAILGRSRALAVEALMAHPLIGSYRLARLLVDDYLAAQRQYTGAWM